MNVALKRSHVPLYLQVAADLICRIENGTWKPGNCIPSIEALSKEFNVARVTIRQAIRNLVEDKLLETKQGKGTFVLDIPKKVHLLTIHSQIIKWSSLRNLFKNTTTNIIDFQREVAIPGIENNEFKVADSYIYMKRINYREKIPFAVVEIYLQQNIYDLNPDLFRAQPVLTTLDELQEIHVNKGKQILTIETAGLDTAEHLKITVNAPVVNSKRYIFDYKNILIYYGNINYRADYVKFEIDMANRKSKFVNP